MSFRGSGLNFISHFWLVKYQVMMLKVGKLCDKKQGTNYLKEALDKSPTLGGGIFPGEDLAAGTYREIGRQIPFWVSQLFLQPLHLSILHHFLDQVQILWIGNLCWSNVHLGFTKGPMCSWWNTNSLQDRLINFYGDFLWITKRFLERRMWVGMDGEWGGVKKLRLGRGLKLSRCDSYLWNYETFLLDHYTRLKTKQTQSSFLSSADVLKA